MSRRVVVTGMGAITPIGLSVEEFWKGIKEEKIGFGTITKFDASEYKCHVAAEVKDFDPKQYIEGRASKRMELFSQYAVAASKELTKKEGILTGISSGAALYAALQLAQRPEFEGKTIVALLPDSGDRYYSTDLFKD